MKPKYLFTLLFCYTCCTGFAPVRAEGNRTYRFQLLGGGKVIARDGPKTTFPSVIRIPDWVKADDRVHPGAVYYLYYSDHHGDFIRMSWAASLHGPWHEYNLGTRVNPYSARGVFDFRADRIRNTYGHIAAPDVHVDEVRRQIVMFYHGQNQPEEVTPNGTVALQHHKSFVATSRNGLNFQDPLSGGGQKGHGPITVTHDGVTRDLCLTGPYQRSFRCRGHWYALTKRGIIFRSRNARNPWEPNPENPFDLAWIQETTPNRLWTENASAVQSSYMSPAATFLASDEFARHPNNPNPGIRIDSSNERINHMSVTLLDAEHLEIFFYVKEDPDDRYNSLYRLVYDLSDENYDNWDVQRDENGLVCFEVVITPEEIVQAVSEFHPEPNALVHPDPVSLGSTGVFIDDDHRKYLFFTYVSHEFRGREGEGQLTGIELLCD